MKRAVTASAVALLSAIVTASSVGPAAGSLLLIGAGDLSNRRILQAFVEAAGGSARRFGVIPTAGGAPSYDDSYHVVRQLRAAGIHDVTIVHASSRHEADSPAFAAQLSGMSGVFIGGGRQWRLADTYLATRTMGALARVLARGGVVAGASAGAVVLGSFLVRGDIAGNAKVIGDHQIGFGFLQGVAVDVHLLSRNRQFDLLDVLKAHPGLLGLGLDDEAALLVAGDRATVIGSGYVAIYDGRATTGSRSFSFLAPGDTYDLAKRTAYRADDGGIGERVP